MAERKQRVMTRILIVEDEEKIPWVTVSKAALTSWSPTPTIWFFFGGNVKEIERLVEATASELEALNL